MSQRAGKMVFHHHGQLLLLALVLGVTAGPGAGPTAASPDPGIPSGPGPIPAPTRAAAALIVPASGSIGQVILPPHNPAGTDGVTVRLTSSDPKLLSVPAAVTIPPGVNSVTFQFLSLAASAPTRVTITADTPFGPAAATTEIVPSSILPAIPAVLSPLPLELLANGDFAAPAVPAGQTSMTLQGTGDLAGWQLLQGPVSIIAAPPAGWPLAPQGSGQSLELGSLTAIEQRFPTEPGRTYLFSGWLAHAPGSSEGRVLVSLDHQPYIQLDHAEGIYGTAVPTALPWTPFSCPFHATGPATVLTLADVTDDSGGGGAVLGGLAVTLVDTEGPPLVPATPLGLTVKTFSSTGVTLVWVDPGSEETAVALWRRGGGTDWMRLAVLAPHTMTFTDTSLTPGTIYSYRVRAINHTVASAWSNEVDITTQQP